MSITQQNNAQTAVAVKQTPALAIGRKASIVITMAFGAFLIYGAGFAMPAALHNMAHDSRHSIAFPCH